MPQLQKSANTRKNRMRSQRMWAAVCLLVLMSVPEALAQRRGTWRQIGEQGDWEGTVAMTAMNGMIWSIEADGTLFSTTRGGEYEQVGPRGAFKNATMLEALDGNLYTIENGTLYRTNPTTKRWRQLGQAGEWESTVAIAGMNGFLYSIESDGSL